MSDVPDSENAALAATAPPVGGSQPVAPVAPVEAEMTAAEGEAAVVQAIAASPVSDIPEIPDFESTETRQPVVPVAAATPATEKVVVPEPVVTPTPAVEPQATPWDKARQDKDQRLANLEKQNEQLLSQMRTLEQGGPVRGVEEIQAEFATLEAAPLDEFATPEEVAERSNKAIALQSELARSVTATQQGTNDAAALDTVLDTVCSEASIGEEYRNGILAGLNEVWDARGYGPGNMPDAQHVYDIAHGIGLELVRAAVPATPVTPAAPVKPTAPLDATHGGVAPVAASTGGAVRPARTVEEAIQHMKEEGVLPR